MKACWSILFIGSLALFVTLIEGASLNTENANKPLSKGINGGNNCMVCTVIVSLTEQLAIVYNQTVEQSLSQLCKFLPSGIFRTSCTQAIVLFGPAIING